MKTLNYFSYAIIAIIFTACSTTSSSIVTDYDRGAQFNQYKTYYWANEFKEGSKSGKKENPLFFNSLIQKRLKNAIQQKMSAMGYTVDEENPDLLVNATVQIEQDKTTRTTGGYPYAYTPFYPGFGHSFGHYYGFYGTTGTSSSSTHMAGGIIIELIDRSERQLVWQGYAPDVLHTDTRDKPKELNEAIASIFSKYDEKLSQ